MTPRKDPLGVLQVIDRLTVGRPEIEPDRLVAPYVVRQGGEEHRIELTTRYEEEVFDPADPGAQNLAALIAAQVALNYGLFCREIVLQGRLDRRDQRFLTDMTRHTAREIYVVKLLGHNPFLARELQGLPAERQPDFLRARLIFESPEETEAGGPWETSPERHAVLSSGGKDSLLSFGLLRELGRETHPIFINESGRHWHTALNAYRHFRDHVEHTARVWTSADRVFTFMLRRLPFVRPDFAKIRSDQYPVRLWTVAVFLFGALPLLRKRGVGRLVIGDEYDSTQRLSHQGITHYGGYYDQSRYFDNNLSRFFGRKRWSLAQFSLLRPLSELLIQKTLTERYPELQRLQVSCHATHLDEDRARPCGRCEKCRRIVGMLVALGAEPTACGYTAEQVEDVLARLGREGVHQEGPGASHLAHLLAERGLLQGRGVGAARPWPRPEVLKLRFDREKSPLDTIPGDLRRPLYEILLRHAPGAVRRSGRVWLDTDPLDENVLGAPYRFERAAPQAPATGERPGFLLAELTWPEAAAALEQVDIALLPVGALEQHGPHLPLDVDTFDAQELCRRVAAACSAPHPLVLPVIPYGVSYHHESFAGTVSVSPDTLAGLVHDIGLSLARQGVTKLVIVNGHGGNGPALHYAAQKINRDARIFTCVDTGETSDLDLEALAETPNDVHAGEVETSTTLATRPELVQLDLARPNVPRFSNEYLEFSSRRGVGWYVRTERLSADGVLGDPTRATAEKGRKIWDVMVRNLVELVEDLKSMTLDEIYQRRY